MSRKIDNFRKALKNLRESGKYEPPYDAVVETGLVNLFSICFEQSWKLMKEVLENEGFDSSKTGSPRMIIKQAYAAGMIEDEEEWLALLEKRNEVAHSYNEDVALAIIDETRKTFLPLFENLEETLIRDWLTK